MKIFASLITLICIPTWAHDHLNLEHGIPLEVEDAYVTSYKNREVHGFLTYDRTPDGKDDFQLVPRLEYGLIQNGQIEVAVPTGFGDSSEEKNGNIDLGVLYNLNQETLTLPAITLGASTLFPTGKGIDGTDVTAKLVLTKTLPVSIAFHRIHINAYWTANDERQMGERDGRFTGILGYQLRVSTDTMFVADYFYEQEAQKDSEVQLVEVGTRYQFNPLTVVAIGLGAGVTDDSPDFRATLGVQRALNLFWSSP